MVDEIKTIELLQTIYKKDVLPYDEAIKLFGDEQELAKLRKVMEEMKLIMPHRADKAFEFTFEGLKTAASTYIPDVAADGEVTEEALFQKMVRAKQS